MTIEKIDLYRGLLGVLVSIVCFGSFAVPIKSKRVVEANIDPLLFQVYKCLACFLFALVLLLFSNRFIFTYWAFLGAALWVLTGTIAIYAVQLAGISVAQTTWSCVPVFLSSLSGILLFGEFPEHPMMTFLGLLLITVGLLTLGRVMSFSRRVHQNDDDHSSEQEDSLEALPILGLQHLKSSRRPFAVGCIAALSVGVLVSCHMIPFKMAVEEDGITSEEYIIPFACCALVLSLAAILVRYGLFLKARPNFCWRTAGMPALLCGVLWSFGNYGTVYAVDALGLSLGLPLVQAQLLVSTSWGLFYYNEVPLDRSVLIPFAGASIAIAMGMALCVIKTGEG